MILGEADCFYLEDAGSRNGTYVNKQRVTTRVRLVHNDVLQFGDAAVRFDCPSDQALSPLQPVGSGESEMTLVGAVQIADERATVTGEVQSGRFTSLDSNPEAKLKAVLEISNSLADTVDLSEMLPKILDTLFQLFTHADRGCIMLKNDETGEMEPRAMKHRRKGEDATVRLSRMVVSKVLEEKKGILSADASLDAAFSASESIADLRIRSMMCVPLIGRSEEPTGVLSIDLQNPLGQFNREDLDILMAIANQAALSYDTTQLMASYVEKQKQDGELKIAHQIQQALLPNVLPQAEGYEFFASYDAAQAVGGDYYDCFDLEGTVDSVSRSGTLPRRVFQAP
jgi:sigma-B regulation protein RsbU (phosphoserine phosphatase)